MTKNVYILTEEGKAYTEEGIQFLIDTIRNNRNDFCDLVFCQGKLYNDTKYLITELRNNPDAYVVISHAHGIEIIFNDNIETLIKNLMEHPNMTSWQIAMDPIDSKYNLDTHK